MRKLKDYMRVSQAAEFIGVNAETLRRWDRAGKLKAYRHPISKYRLYSVSDLRKLLNKVK